MQRLSERVTVSFPGLVQCERAGWTRAFIGVFAEALSKTVECERSLEKDLYRTRMKGMEAPASQIKSLPEQLGSSFASESHEIDIRGRGGEIDTAFGSHDNSNGHKNLHLTVQEVALDFGGTLSQPDISSVTFKDNDKVAVGDTDTNPNTITSLDLGLSHQPGMQCNCIACFLLLRIACATVECTLTNLSVCLDRSIA
jgi:hypothetical protein